MKVPTTIDLSIKTEREFPSLYEVAAELDDPKTNISRIGISVGNSFQFYLFSKKKDGPNGSYVASFNITSLIQDVLAAYEKETPK